jgi:hypothetical protein
MVGYMRKIFKKIRKITRNIKSILKYGKIKRYEDLGEFTLKNGDGGFLLFGFDNNKNESVDLSV